MFGSAVAILHRQSSRQEMRSRTLFGTSACLFVAVLPFVYNVYGALVAGEADVLERAYDDYGVEDTTAEADYFHFVTRSDIRALKWDISVYDERAISSGYWFLAPYALLGQKQRGEAWIGPYIYDGKGDLHHFLTTSTSSTFGRSIFVERKCLQRSTNGQMLV